jgi:hypothetical protein
MEESVGETGSSATTLAARLITGARSALQTALPDRDLTVTQANVRKHRGTPDSRASLNYAVFRTAVNV